MLPGILLAATIQLGDAQPVVEVLTGEQRTVRSVSRSVDDMPAHHPYLLENADDPADRETYFQRLDEYIAVAHDCTVPGKVSWLLDLAYFTRRTDNVRAKLAPLVDKIVLDEPRCFLLAVEQTFMARAADVLREFVFDREPETAARLQAALRPLLSDVAFGDLAATFVSVEDQQRKIAARHDAERQRRIAYEREHYRSALRDPELLENDPNGYWHRWEELTREARDCEDIDEIANIFEASRLHVSEPLARRRSATFVEALVMANPQCALEAIEEMDIAETFIDNYLLHTEWHDVDVLRGPLVYSPAEGNAAKARQRYERAYARYLRENRPLLADPRTFLWSVKLVHVDNDGRLYVPLADRPGNVGRFNQLWQQARDEGVRGTYERAFRTLPLDAFNFVTAGQLGTYYVVVIGDGAASSVKATPVKAALAEWYCRDDVAPLLLLEPESRPAWLPESGAWTSLVAVELRDDLPLPSFEELEYDERMFTHGRMTWPAAGRSFDFYFTGAYTDVIFNVTDNQTGEEHGAISPGWMCH